jgi:hypothetical protein
MLLELIEETTYPIATTVEVLTGVSENAIVAPKSLYELLNYLGVIYGYGTTENLYMPDFNITTDTLKSDVLKLSNALYKKDSLLVVGDNGNIIVVKNQYIEDSINIVWFSDIYPIQDSLATAFDTLSSHNTRLLEIKNEATQKATTLQALTGEIDTAYVSPEKLVDIIKMLSFQNYGQVDDVYAPDVNLTIDTLKVNLPTGFAMISSGRLTSTTVKGSYTGNINGTNKDFTLDSSPVDLMVYLNGIYQMETINYTISGSIITFVIAPYTDDILTIKYKYIRNIFLY